MNTPELLKHVSRFYDVCKAAAGVSIDPFGIAVPIPKETSVQVLDEVVADLIKKAWRLEVAPIGRLTYIVLFPYGN